MNVLKQRIPKRMLQTHLAEDELQKLTLGLRTKLNLYDQLSEFPETEPVLLQKQLIQAEVQTELRKILSTGFSLSDILARLDSLIVKKDVLQAAEAITNAEKAGVSHKLFDMVSEERILRQRAQKQEEPDFMDSIFNYTMSYLPSKDLIEQFREPEEEPTPLASVLPPQDLGEMQNSQSEVVAQDVQTPVAEAPMPRFQMTPKMQGNELVKTIEKALIVGNEDQAKSDLKLIMKDYLLKIQGKQHKYDVNPKGQKLIPILRRLYPALRLEGISSMNIAAAVVSD